MTLRALRTDIAFRSQAEFYRQARTDAVRELRPIGTRGATLIRAEQRAGDWSDAPTPDLTLGMIESESIPSTIDLGAGRFRTRRETSSFILIAPRVGSSIIADGLHVSAGVAVPYGNLLALAGPESELPADGDFGRLHTGHSKDNEVSVILAQLWSEARSGNVRGALFADGCMLQLAAALLRLRGHKPTDCREAKHRLSSRALARTLDRIEAELTGDLSLEVLAATAGLSPWHFARAFKGATGEPPHRYLTRLRVQRAQEMLASTTKSVTEVAHACGFASSQHMATVFRRVVGTTPTAHRRHRSTW